MAYGITVRRRVEFIETDMMGIVHFSNFFRYAEAAETAFFRSLGVPVIDGGVAWPRVHAEFDFKKPLRFEEEFEVELLVLERRPRSLVYGIRIRNANGEEAAVGKLVAACVRTDPETGALSAVALPEAVAAAIDPAPAEFTAAWMRTPARAC